MAADGERKLERVDGGLLSARLSGAWTPKG
jgi:hypothetical protein